MIKPCARPLEVADEETARELTEQNLQAFVDELTDCGGELADEPERDVSSDEAADTGGCCRWPATSGCRSSYRGYRSRSYEVYPRRHRA